MATNKEHRVFIKDDQEAWVPAVIVEKSKTEGRCRLEECGGERIVKLKDYRGFELPRQNSEIATDLVDMEHLHEPGILYNLLQRHADGKPYTRSGDLVVSINPFQWISDLYSESNRNFYAKQLVWKNSNTDPRQGLEAHIYEVSALSYAELAFQGKNQSILITGESGSGKTEAAKLLMHHIASIQRGPVDVMESHSSNCVPTAYCDTVQRILHANPLLEAFGNAATSRNDNSSRFGKYTQLQFDKGDPALAAYNLRTKALCVLAGSQCEVYLLETSRVCIHAVNERTYHIFYQLLAAHDDRKEQIWNGLVGKTAADYKYVGTETIGGVSDADNFLEVCSALGRIGMESSTVILLMRAICIVMQLGNIVFAVDPTCDDRAVVQSKDEFASLSELMGISEEDLLLAFTERTMMTRGETFKVPLSASSAKEACDAFAKEIYLTTFLWLVRTINDKTCAEKNYTHDPTHGDFGVIGLLDIFGFESFETNGFGQLCINYANEKLQQKAINDIFRETKEEYEYEGIPLRHVEIDDNEQVLKVIEGRSGLIALLNEECYRPRGNDKAFVSKVLENHKESRFVLMPKRGSNTQFGVAHFAGKVMYTAGNFVEHNQDTLPFDLKECAKKCSNGIVAELLNSDSSANRVSAKSTDEEPVSLDVTTSSITEEYIACSTKSTPTLRVPSKGSPPYLNEVAAGKRPVFDQLEARAVKVLSPFSTAARLKQDPAGRRQPFGNNPDSFGGKASTLHNKSTFLMKRTISEPLSQVSKSGSTQSTPKRSTSSDLIAATVWTKYQDELSSLMSKLGGTHSRYVRCIKPNPMRKPNVMHRLSVTEQLRCAGIVATVKLSRAIYPHALPNKVLRCRYLSMWDQRMYPSKAKRVDKMERRQKLECEAILACALKQLDIDSNGKSAFPYAVGKTRTYFRKGALEWLEAKRVLELDRMATVIEKRARGVLTRLHMSRIRIGAYLIQKWYRRILNHRRLKLDRLAILIQKQVRGVLFRLNLSKVRLVVPVIQRWYRSVAKHRKAVEVIQKWYRMILKRKRLKLDSLAIVIQKQVRGVLSRLNLSKVRLVVPVIQRWYRRVAKHRKAVEVIQKWYRMILKRKRLKLDSLAIVIQKRVRGVLSRLNLSKVRLVVPVIQRWYRRVAKHRKTIKVKLDFTANVIQRWYRWVSEHKRQKHDALATAIQKQARGVLTRHRISKIRMAVPIIQRWYRETSKQRKVVVPLPRRRFLEARSVFEQN
jgi:myosin heavy subunit